MNFNNFWVVLIFVIIIILLLLNLFDVKIEFFDQAIDKVTDDIDFMSTGDGKIKGSSSILKDDIKIDHKVVDGSDEAQNTKSSITNDNANELNKVINKSELNQDLTITPKKPIDIELTTNKQETKDKVYENKTPETYKLKETGDKYVNLTDEEKAINEEMKKRFDNQEKEYKKAFKGKNELDYDGSVITDENIYANKVLKLYIWEQKFRDNWQMKLIIKI